MSAGILLLLRLSLHLHLVDLLLDIVVSAQFLKEADLLTGLWLWLLLGLR